ncbi:MAG: sugar transferase [Lentisphaeria bacterium]|nr:sugar transferase [Lentisphaeria bacterium]
MKIPESLNEQQRRRIVTSIYERGSRRRPNGKVLAWKLTVEGTRVCKRFFDIVVALAAVFCLSPLMIGVALLIVFEDRGRIIYRQVRVGKDGRHFNFYKFRSMVEGAERQKERLLAANQSRDGVIFKMQDDPRVTRVGRFIRKYSIDELPQLFNVLAGDMSLVGPRPPLPSEVSQYTIEDRKRLHVLPGITCIWQVSGRSDIPFKQQVQLDKEYIRSQGLWQDVKILLKTIPAVFTGRGAY